MKPRADYEPRTPAETKGFDRDPRRLADAISCYSTTSDTVAAKLMAIGGRSERTESGIDLKTAAAKLGVTVRTAQRWLKAEQEGRSGLSKQNSAKLAKAARQTYSTQAGRRALVANSPMAQKAKRDGLKITISGLMGKADYKRMRSANHGLSPEDTQEFFSVWESRGEGEAMNYLEASMDRYYLNDFQIDSVDQFDFAAMRDREWAASSSLYAPEGL